MRPFRTIGLGLLACVALTVGAPTAAVREGASDASTAKARRLALVVGNADYPTAPLRNPVNDVRDVAVALQGSGFDVVKLENANLRQLRMAVRDFGDRLKREGGVGLFYYAGHAMQLGGRNYLIAVGAQIEREDEIEFESLDVNMVLEKLDSAGNRFNIVILDACRNNPFARAFRSTAQGLAQMDAPSGTVIAFATSPGSVASDGPGRNGLYTHHLIEAVGRPGLKLEDVFKQVRAAVRRDSNGQQIPWESTSLEGDFYFHPVAAATTEAAQKQEEQRRVDEMVRIAIARERELIRREMEQARLEEAGKAKSPGAPAKATAPSVAPSAGKGAPPGIATAVTPEAASGPMPTAPAGVVGSRFEEKISAPHFLVGDEWEILSITSPAAGSGYEPVSWIDRITVVGVSEQRLSLSSARLDRPGGAPVGQAGTYKVTPQLATLFDRKNAFDGQRKYLSFPLEVNASWAYSYEYPAPDGGGRFRDDLECKVVGWEQVTVPAGTFWALKIEQRGWRNKVSPNVPSSGRRAAPLERTFWYSPEVKYTVKSEFRRGPGAGVGGGGYSTHQLVRFSGAAPKKSEAKPSPVQAEPPAVADLRAMVDLHEHLRGEMRPESLIQLMDQVGISRMVLMPNGTGSRGERPATDEQALSYAERFPGRFIPFLSLMVPVIQDHPERWRDPNGPTMRFLTAVEDKLKSGRFYGMGELIARRYGYDNPEGHKVSEHDNPLDSALVHKLADLAARYNVVMDIHAEGEPGVVDAMGRVLAAHPRATIIWAHNCGRSSAAKLREFLLRYPNLMCDLGSMTDTFERTRTQPPRAAMIEDGQGNLLPEMRDVFEEYADRFAGIGMDSPRSAIGKGYDRHVQRFRRLLSQLSLVASRKIAHENAERLFHLPPVGP